jgi:hypothetical protein
MIKHRDDDCIDSLAKLRRRRHDDPLVIAEYLEIKATVLFDEETEAEQVGAGGALAPWKALFAPNMFKRLSIGCWIMIFQQFTGINAVLYYAPQVRSLSLERSHRGGAANETRNTTITQVSVGRERLLPRPDLFARTTWRGIRRYLHGFCSQSCVSSQLCQAVLQCFGASCDLTSRGVSWFRVLTEADPHISTKDTSPAR